MSNYSAKFVLTEMMTVLDEKFGFFKNRSPKEVSEILEEFVKMGNVCQVDKSYVLKSIGMKYNICYSCGLPVKDLNESGMCNHCISEMNGEDLEINSFIIDESDLIVDEYDSGITDENYVGELMYKIKYKKTGYETKSYYLKEEALTEIKRYLNNEILEKYTY